jgi:hypothetical protein
MAQHLLPQLSPQIIYLFDLEMACFFLGKGRRYLNSGIT